MEPTNEVKRIIVENELKGVCNSIYQLTVRARVMKNVEDKQGYEGVTKELEKVEKMKDEYEKELKAIEEEK